MSTSAPRAYDFRVIALDLIDEPPLPMRETFDDEKMVELIESIRDKGVQSPLGVYERDGRFVVIYGHRRRVAAAKAGELALPCRVHADGSAREEDYKFTENYYREDVNPGEEATWLAHLLEHKHGGNMDRLCRELGLKASFVDGRLELLRGDDAVLLALKQKRINLAVARELNKIRDEGYRALYLDDAIKQGATASTVQSWRMNVERLATLNAAAVDGAHERVGASTEASIGSADECILCRQSDDPLDMKYVRVHISCHKVHRREQDAARQG